MSEARFTYGSIIIMFVVAAIFLTAMYFLIDAILTPLEGMVGRPVHSPAIARLYAAVRSFYLTLRYVLTTPQGILALVAASLVLAAFEVVRER